MEIFMKIIKKKTYQLMKNKGKEMGKIKKKMLLIGFILCFIVTGGLTTYAGKAEYELIYSHTGNKAITTWWAAEEFKKRLEKYSRDRIEVDINPSGVMGSDVKVIELVRMGQIDICHTSAGNYASVGRALMPFNLPLLISGGPTKWYMLLTGEIRDDINARFEKDGFKLLMLYHQGMTRDLMTSKKAIRKFEDGEGIKLRSVASPINQALLSSWGLNPTPIAWSESYTAISQGVVNGIYVDPMSAEMSKISELIKYVTRPGGALLLSGAVMNLENYNKLPTELRDAVDRAASEAELWSYGIEQTLKGRAVKAMQAKGVEFIDLSPEDQAKYEKAARSIWEDLIKKLNLDREFIKKVVKAGNEISLD